MHWKLCPLLIFLAAHHISLRIYREAYVLSSDDGLSVMVVSHIYR